MENKWLLIDAGYACGSVGITKGVITGAAPIFRRWAIRLTEEELRRRVRVIDDSKEIADMSRVARERDEKMRNQ